MARELFPIKKVISFDQRMIAEIEKWRLRQEAKLPSANAAIRALIARELARSRRRGGSAGHEHGNG